MNHKEMTTEELKARAKKLRKEQYYLINYTRNANRFGDCEAELTKIYTELNSR